MENNNEINQRQNSEEILLYLFAQRKIYSLSKRTLKYLFIVNLIFYTLGINNSIQNSNHFKTIYVFWGLLFCILYIREIDRINIAAIIQEIIDRKLYGFDIDTPFIKNTYLHKALEIKSKFSKEYDEQVRHNGQENGVKDWYSDVSDISIEKAIILCQLENCEWEIKLRKQFQILNIALFLLLIIIYVVIYWNNSIETLVVKLFPIIAIVIDRLGYIYKNNKNINGSKNINNYLYQIYEHIEKHTNTKEDTINKSKEIQHCIYERRKNFAPIPDVFYHLHRKKYQKFSNEYILELKKKLQNSP
jgi:hypothetical protein